MTNQDDYFFTSPKLEPLGLDLKTWSGGGSCPAQYEGETQDGRAYYIRYRGGQFSINLANKPGIGVFEDGREIINEKIGPRLHGELAIAQACEYAGLTINGEKPPMPDEDEMFYNGYLDLSGQTTFFNLITQSSTEKTTREFLKALQKLDNVVCLINWEDSKSVIYKDVSKIDNTNVYVCISNDVNMNDLVTLSKLDYRTIKQEYLMLRTAHSVLFHKHRRYYSGGTEKISEIVGKKLRVTGQVEDCFSSPFSISGHFLSDDMASKEKLVQISKLFEKFYPKVEIEGVDLMTGKALEEHTFTMPLDPMLMSWLNKSDNHWLRVWNVGNREKPVYAGFRPKT